MNALRTDAKLLALFPPPFFAALDIARELSSNNLTTLPAGLFDGLWMEAL